MTKTTTTTNQRLFPIHPSTPFSFSKANAGNVEIVRPQDDKSVTELEGMRLKLLSLRRFHEELQSFRAPSLQPAE